MCGCFAFLRVLQVKKVAVAERLFQLFHCVPFVLYVFHLFINVLEHEKTLKNQRFLMCFVPIVPLFHAFCKFFIYIIYIIFIYIFLLYYYIKVKNNWNIGTNKEKHVEKPVFPGFCMFHFYKFLRNMNWNSWNNWNKSLRLLLLFFSVKKQSIA